MAWKIWLVKWKQKRARRIEKKKLKQLQKEDFKAAMRQLYQKINLLPMSNSHFISCRFLETAKRLRAEGFEVEFNTESADRYWYKVSWKE